MLSLTFFVSLSFLERKYPDMKGKIFYGRYLTVSFFKELMSGKKFP